MRSNSSLNAAGSDDETYKVPKRVVELRRAGVWSDNPRLALSWETA